MHDHHITYRPEVKKRLCVAHHEEITIINGIQGRKYRRQLSNKHRWWIWFQWLEGKLKPRKTKKAMEYIEEMRRGPERLVVVRSVEIEPEPIPAETEPAHRTPKRKKKRSPKKKKKPSVRLKVARAKSAKRGRHKQK